MGLANRLAPQRQYSGSSRFGSSRVYPATLRKPKLRYIKSGGTFGCGMNTKISTAIVAAVLAMAPAASAGPALLFNASSRAVLYAEDFDTEWHPASLTKVMTAYVTFQAIKDGALTLETK